MAVTETAPRYTRQFWAKSEPREGYPKRIHLLEHHLADVGACFEALLAQPTIRRRLARSGGCDDLDAATVARLSLFAAFHDIGKVNVGFQTRIWRDADLPGGRRHQAIRWAGHYRELVPLMMDDNSETSKHFFDSLDWWDDALNSWDDCGGETVCGLFIAALSHHGQPLQLEGKDTLPHNSRLWTGMGGLDPFAQLRRIGELARRWFPKAWESSGQSLPSKPEFQHHFLGLCTLADWIGSNEDWFPFCDEPDDNYIHRAREQARQTVKKVGLDIAEQWERFTGAPEFGALFPRIDGQPNAIQQAAADAPLDEPLVIIESETGSGKTEAALWRFARMYEGGLVDGLYFALPTRAAAVQLHRRVRDFAASLFPEQHRPPVVLAVPGYEPDADAEEVALQGYNSHAAGHHEADDRPWAAESSKRYLAAQIAVGTVDQAMMAALKVRHSHMRAACLSRNLLVVDEVHASDPYMRRILKALLDAHRGAGGYALLMSATLGSAARHQWLATGRVNPGDAPPLDDAIAAPYPAVTVMSSGGAPTGAGENNRPKTVHITAKPLIHDFGQAAETALQAARAGVKVLVIRNTVSYAIATQEALEQAAGSDRGLLFSANGVITLHHSRFAPGDRRLLDGEVESRLGRERPAGGLVVVGTQTLEQSLDIDADLLITDLCPVDVLLQRIGRLHRHDRDGRPAIPLSLWGSVSVGASPACVVLTPDGEDLSPLLQRGSPNRTGLGPYGNVYEDLRVLEATRRLIAEYPQWDIPRMNRLLVENATHPTALQAIEALGEAWQEHANKVMGGELADGLTAANAVVQRGKSFFLDNREVLFGSDEERIRTRLGDEGVELEFNPPPASPFDGTQRIKTMTIANHLLRGAAPDGPVSPAETEGGFTFAVGARGFRYDRLGLRRE